MQIFRVLLAATLLCYTAGAQTRSSKPKPRPAQGKPTAAADLTQPFPLTEIAVEGNQQFPDDQIIALSGIHKGQSVSKKDFDAAQQRLLQTGLFETVAYRFEAIPNERAYRARFEVKEIDQLFPYRFEAIDADEKAMRAWLREREPAFRDHIPATEPVLKRMGSALDEYLATQGRPIHVIGKLMPNGANKMEVVFQPASLPAVAEITFKGNKTLTTAALQQAAAGAGIGALYTEARFRQILDASVRPLFEAEGRLRVSFPKLETAPAANVKGLIVTIHIDEGPQYKLNNVTITGPMSGDRAVLKAGHFRTGEIANMTAVDAGIKDIERSLRRRGYLKADAKPVRKIDDKAKMVDVAVELDPGPQFRMGTLVIEGLDIQTEPEIRKLWALKPNQPFDNEYPDIFLAKMPEVLDSLGRTRSKVNPDPGTLKVDVTLYFEGEKREPKKPMEEQPQERNPNPMDGSPFPFLAAKSETLSGVLMDAACPVISGRDKNAKPGATTVREKYQDCKAKATTKEFALHVDGRLYILDNKGNELVQKQMRNEAFRASMTNRDGSVRWISITVEGAVSGDTLAVTSVRR